MVYLYKIICRKKWYRIAMIGSLFSLFGISLYRMQSDTNIFQNNRTRTSDRLMHDITKRRFLWNKFFLDGRSNNLSVRLPNVICIGVKKCGTTALVRFLHMHPQVKATRTLLMETKYFTREYKTQGIDYYRNLFEPSLPTDVVMEKTPGYFYNTQFGTAKRIKKTLPNVKILLIVCDPTKRAFSDYVHEYERDLEVKNKYRNFDDFVEKMFNKVPFILQGTSPTELNITKTEKDIIMGGLYSEYLPTWYEYFTKSSVFVMNGEEFISNPGPIMIKLQNFLGIKEMLTSQDFVRHPKTGLYCLRPWWMNYTFELNSWENNLCMEKNKGRTRSSTGNYQSMKNETYNRLRTFYEPYNKKFYRLVNNSMNW